MQGSATQEQADMTQRATMALLDALRVAGVDDNPTVCLAAAGALLGSLAATSGNPTEALAAANAVARGIIDGTLLD
jgi:hypothetical protein